MLEVPHWKMALLLLFQLFSVVKAKSMGKEVTLLTYMCIIIFHGGFRKMLAQNLFQ
jgi:antibiotic biosynthesis monooxygenase (ABM) superfamily enzyme